MSEFKLPGDYFVSEWNGSSANPGTATSPFAHPADALSSYTNVVVLGTGLYKGGWTGQRRLIGDGEVTIDLLGIAQTNGGTIFKSYTNINFRNSPRLGDGSTIGNQVQHINSRFSEIEIIGLSHGEHNNCLFFQNTSGLITFYGQHIQLFSSGIFENIYWNIAPGSTSTRAFNCVFLAKGKKITFSVFDSNIQAGFVNSCVNGVLNIGGIDYELKKAYDGSTRADADPLILDVIAVFANVYTNGNFATVDPKFLDQWNRIVAPDSDLLKKSHTYGYIGGVRAGKFIPVNSSDPNVIITTTDIDTTDPLNWIIQSPATEGFINIVWKISDTIAEVQRIFLDALLSFYGDATGGTTENNNVPDNFPTSYSTLSAAGLKPNRLIYELRTSQSIGMPTVDSQWDNDSAALGTTAGNYYLQEWNTKPTIATVLGVPYGNGNPAGIGGATNGINARWGQARIRLTNNRAY